VLKNIKKGAPMNVKKLIVGLFAAFSLTEIAYPIIFTGPARRNAHRQEEQQAALEGYMLGKDAGDKNENEEQNDEVETQAIDETGTGQSRTGAEQRAQVIAKIKNRLAKGDLPPQVKAALEKKLAALESGKDQKNVEQMRERFKNFTQHHGALDNSSNQDSVITQSVEETTPEQEPAQELSHEEMVAAAALTDAAQELAASPVLQEEVNASVENEEPLSAPAQDVPATLEQATQVAQQLEQAAHAPALMEIQVPAEQSIKIVKVYPVYEALQAGFAHLKCAAQDMIDYVYNFVHGSKKSEVTVQCKTY